MLFYQVIIKRYFKPTCVDEFDVRTHNYFNKKLLIWKCFWNHNEFFPLLRDVAVCTEKEMVERDLSEIAPKHDLEFANLIIASPNPGR